MTILADAPRTRNRQASDDRARGLRQQIDDSLDTLAKAVDEVRASDTFRRYLDVQARFHRYSWHNSMLILMQKPDASQVAGYRAWQKLGRQVRKGERGIMIFAPRPFHRETENANGETETVDGIYFRPVHVFDVGQTDGEALPTVDVPTVDTAADDLLADLLRVAQERKIDVKLGAVAGGAFGASKHGSIDRTRYRATSQDPSP